MSGIPHEAKPENGKRSLNSGFRVFGQRPHAACGPGCVAGTSASDASDNQPSMR